MFEHLEMAPPDSILGLAETFKNDPNPNKINLTVGVFKTEAGNTPILDCVKAAEKVLLESEKSKGYLGIDGLPQYCEQVRSLLLGADHPAVKNKTAVTVQTPGGTGGLRVAAELLGTKFPQIKVWFSKPTWPNHPTIFEAAGLQVGTYGYLDASGTALDFDGLLKALKEIPNGDAVCFHACCHNPTGVDPTAEQWEQIAAVVKERNILPIIDCAYQGFGDGLDADSVGMRTLIATGNDALICSSFSKNFGLYGERVGALTLIAGTPEAAQAVLSHAKGCVRANYSNPPMHGASIVATVLADDALRAQWESELADMRVRIHDMRELFVSTMKSVAPDRDFSYINSQKGMFSYSGLNPMQVDRLKNEFAIYMVGSGRINIAGITPKNVKPLCDAIAQVL